MILNRRKLEILIEKIPSHPKPKLFLEQYTIPAYLASTILWIAEFRHHDIKGNIIADFGCGTGRLAIGSALLGAERVIGVDIDEDPLKIAVEYSRIMNVHDITTWILGDVLHVKLRNIDVVLQNPPFGVHEKLRGIDLKFLIKALETARVVYSLHKTSSETRKLFMKVVREHGGRITEILTFKLDLKPTYIFHRRKHYLVTVDLYRVEVVR